jgi:hypothetical protein
MKTMGRSSAFGGYLWRVFPFLLPRSLACAQVQRGPGGDEAERLHSLCPYVSRRRMGELEQEAGRRRAPDVSDSERPAGMQSSWARRKW